ncbi:MAG: PilZ domain-containing protein [Magnetococcales bacterium]|nr:PilZ domain-containing protein [Magnetococcales bacterium]NGZ04952.1 PilZ domain-containing protein [Magnetococcales bacterium]
MTGSWSGKKVTTGSPATVRPKERRGKPPDQRGHERYGMCFPVTITFENGERLHGESEDVSLTGFFMVTPQDGRDHLERVGSGTIQLGKEHYTFACRVARQTARGIALNITKDCAMLGYAIANFVFNEMSSKRLCR